MAVTQLRPNNSSAALASQPDIPYRAFSGANIYATIGNRRVGTLQALTVSITREVAALYAFADANPKAFVKGKRGIAGSLVFTQFDRHALLRDVFQDAFGNPLRDDAGLFSSAFTSSHLNSQANLLGGDSVQTSNFDKASDLASAINAQFGANTNGSITTELATIYDLVAQQRLVYSDQIPPFDITITMVNESGDAAFAVIGGVVLVNEGWGYTLDDLVSEVAFTYVARAISPLTAITGTLPNAKINTSARSF